MAKRLFGGLIAGALLAGAAPALAQGSITDSFSNGYNFLKAVKERDGEKATALIVEPGSIVVNHKDPGSGEGALHILTRERDLTWLRFMLGKGANPNLQDKQGNTALVLAAQLGWRDGAEALLGRGAKVDLANNRGETPLIFAVQHRNLDMVRLLVSNGADPKRQDSIAGYSALDYAKRDGRMAAIVEALEQEKKPKRQVAGPSL